MARSPHYAGLRFFLIGLIAITAWAGTAFGQIINNPITTSTAGGIEIDADGVVHYRETAAKADTVTRNKARLGLKASDRDEKLAYVSLPKAFEQAKSALAAGKEIPEELKYLGGMTSLKYVIAFPEEHDLVIAGPSEPWDATNKLQPLGKITGRPVMLLEDIVVSMRTVHERGHQWTFGCSMDPPNDSLEKSARIMKEYANTSRAERMKAMADAIGPQSLVVFGMAQNTRIAFVCCAADYKLKRMSLGLDTPVYGIGSSVDNTRQASHRVGFEAKYDPILVAPDGNMFEIRGQRIQVTAGALVFDKRGATSTAMEFAKNFTKKVPQLCVAVPIYADLQNIADMAVLANLIHFDHLDRRVEWDASWVLDPKGFPVTVVPVPHTAETLVNYTNGSICAGGIAFTIPPVISPENRLQDEKGELAAARQLMDHAKLERSPQEPNPAITHGAALPNTTKK